MKDGAAPRPKERKGFRRRTEREQPQWLPGRGAIPPAASPPPPRGPLTARDVGPMTTPADWTPAAPAAPSAGPADADVAPPTTGRKDRRKPEPFRRNSGGTVFGPAEPPPTLEMEAVGADGPAAARRKAAHYAAAPLAPDEIAPTVADRLASSKTVVLGALVVALLLTAGAAALLLPDDSDSGQAAADETDDSGLGSGFSPSTDDDDGGIGQASSSSTSEPDATTTTDTTSSTTTTTLLGVVDPTPVTTTLPSPSTTRPTTSTSAAPTTTTTQPKPVVNSFNAQVEQFGCGRNASPATISWSTTGATSVTLGRVGQGASGVAVDGSVSDVCVDDGGENWRLTASGPGGTTTQDLNINP
jgi:hypothetical protein